MIKKVAIAFVMLMSMGVMAQSSVATVNSQKVLDTMPSRAKAEQELVDFERKAQEELKERQTKFQEDYQKFMTQCGSGENQTMCSFEQSRLEKEQQVIQLRAQELEQQMQILGKEKNAPILEMVQTAIKIVSEREKINYVIDESVVLYMNGKDITNQVIIEVLKLDNGSSEN